MGFDEQVKMLIEEAEIPERLSPENIAVMLKEKTAEKNRKEIKMSSAGIKSKNRAVAIRSAAAVAACIALSCGVTAVINNNNRPTVENPDYIQGHKVSDYHDVYSAIQDTIINNPADDGIGWGEISNDTVYPDVTEIEEYGSRDYLIKTFGRTAEDITVTDGKNLYCILNGALNVISAENGTMTELIKIENAEKAPVGMYIAGNRLIVVSNNTVEVPYTAGNETAATGENGTADSTAETTTAPSLPETVTQNNTVIDIYNIADKTNVKLENTYKQNGAYISSSMDGSVLYVVSNYSNFRTKPLDSEEDLDNYIPAYFTDDGKNYVGATDITIPSKASNNYTIVAGLDIEKASPFRSIKVVLANGKSAYFTDNSVYVAGNSSGSASISKFVLSGGDVYAPIVATVDGQWSDITAIDEYNGTVRISTSSISADGSKNGVSISVFDENLISVMSLNGLCAGKNVSAVEFKGNKAYIIISGENEPYEVTLDGSENAPVAVSDKSVYLYKCTDTEFLGISAKTDENGKADGIVLTMYSTADGINFEEISSIEANGVLSAALSGGKLDLRALLIDSENGIIGIPTVKSDTYGNSNLYYVFSYKSGEGFSALGSIEYTDLSKKYEFKRSVIIDDTLYAVSDGRIVSARISDIKVIETFEID